MNKRDSPWHISNHVCCGECGGGGYRWPGQTALGNGSMHRGQCMSIIMLDGACWLMEVLVLVACGVDGDQSSLLLSPLLVSIVALAVIINDGHGQCDE